jgi:hypothetical protein
MQRAIFQWPKFVFVLVGAQSIALIVGCDFTAKSSVELPKVSPRAAAAAAIRLYDKDGNGSLSSAELEASPALKTAQKEYDQDKNDGISQEEIVARFEHLFGASVGLLTVDCTVVRQGKPLANATVKFIPEPFLGDAIQPAIGTTSETGSVTPGIAVDKLPSNLQREKLMQPGIYRVEIQHPSVTAKNTKPIGAEIDPSRRDGTTVTINL